MTVLDVCHDGHQLWQLLIEVIGYDRVCNCFVVGHQSQIFGGVVRIDNTHEDVRHFSAIFFLVRRRVTLQCYIESIFEHGSLPRADRHEARLWLNSGLKVCLVVDLLNAFEIWIGDIHRDCVSSLVLENAVCHIYFEILAVRVQILQKNVVRFANRIQLVVEPVSIARPPTFGLNADLLVLRDEHDLTLINVGVGQIDVEDWLHCGQPSESSSTPELHVEIIRLTGLDRRDHSLNDGWLVREAVL